MKQLILLLAVCMSVSVAAQGKKKIRKYSVTSVTAMDHEDGRVLNNRKKVFNKDGEVLEDYDYDKHGELKCVRKYRYDKDGEVILEEEQYPENHEYTKTECKYDGMGNKTEEHIYNGQGKKIKIHRYTYDNRGLKQERRTTDAEGHLLGIRKYSYTFK